MKKVLLLLTALIGLFTSCQRDDKYELKITTKADRTVLVYMLAENNLNGYAYENIEKMMKGVTQNPNYNVNYVVYLDPASSDAVINHEGGSQPRIIHIKKGVNGQATREIIKWYPEMNSSDPLVMRSVIDFVFERFPSQEYGLMLWSHGMGWLPVSFNSKLQRAAAAPAGYEGMVRLIDQSSRSFGQDGSNWMEISDLQSAIPDNKFDFIIFDACYMACVEVAYALRNKADYIISATTEILVRGFPYDEISGPMFAPTIDLQAICEEYYKSYADISSDAVISLVKTSELTPLANIVGNIINTNRAASWSVNVQNIQKFDRGLTPSHLFLDMTDLISNIAQTSQMAEFEAQMDKTVLYKAATDHMLGMNIIKHSGLSMHYAHNSTFLTFYQTFEWYDLTWK